MPVRKGRGRDVMSVAKIMSLKKVRGANSFLLQLTLFGESFFFQES